MSKAFRFSLQKILNYRKSVEDKHAITLKRSQSVLNRAEENLHKTEHTKNRFLDEKSENSRPVSLTELQISTDYLSQINGLIDRQTVEVAKSEEIVEIDRAALLKAVKERKITEKLREHKLAEFTTDSRKKELLSQSEIALQVTAKNRASMP